MREAIAQARDLLFTTRRNGVKCVKYICMKLPTWPSRWGMHISIDWPRLKSCQAVCDECTRGEIYSSLSRDAGCLAMWSWRESCVTKIWGSGAWSRIRVISFRYHGFPYSTIGDFLDPYIRVIRGPYCIWILMIMPKHWNFEGCWKIGPKDLGRPEPTNLSQHHVHWWCGNIEPVFFFTNVLRALQNNAKIYNNRNHTYGGNFKLQLCT